MGETVRAEVSRGTAAQANASERNGWVMGPFMPHTSLAYDPTHEVKLWCYKTDPEYGVKGFHGRELIVIYGGRIHLRVFFDTGGDAEFVLDGRNRDFIILPPHRKHVSAERCPAFGVTIRSKVSATS